MLATGAAVPPRAAHMMSTAPGLQSVLLLLWAAVATRAFAEEYLCKPQVRGRTAPLGMAGRGVGRRSMSAAMTIVVEASAALPCPSPDAGGPGPGAAVPAAKVPRRTAAPVLQGTAALVCASPPPRVFLAAAPPKRASVILTDSRPCCPVFAQYGCSCCNRTHGLALYRALYAAMEDASFSRACLALQTRVSCRVCDPEVR